MAKSQTKSNKNIWVIVIIVILLAVIAYFLLRSVLKTNSSSNVLEENVKVGFIGTATAETENVKKGIGLALKDSGMKNFEVLYESSECNVTQATDAMNKLIAENERTLNKLEKSKVVAVITSLCTEATMALAPIAEQNKIVLITTTSTSSQITSAGEFTFRTVPSDLAQGKAAGDIIFNKGYKTIGVLYENKYNDELKEGFEETFKGPSIATETFNNGMEELLPQLIKITSPNPEAIFIISNSDNSSVIAFQQLQQLNFRTALFGSEALKTLEIAGLPSADGLNIIQLSSGTAEFKNKYKTEYGEEPGKFAAQGYDALAALVTAIKAGGADGEQIKNKLYSMQFDGASGKIDFDYYGDIAGNYEVYQLKNKNFEMQV